MISYKKCNDRYLYRGMTRTLNPCQGVGQKRGRERVKETGKGFQKVLTHTGVLTKEQPCMCSNKREASGYKGPGPTAPWLSCQKVWTLSKRPEKPLRNF
jgi:hypothetical protein